MTSDQEQFLTELSEHVAALPPKVQEAIASAEIITHLQDLAKIHKLHVDKWELLQNEVMMILIGVEPVAQLQTNLQEQVGLDAATAQALAADVSRIVFDPIRAELEKITHPSEPADPYTPSTPPPPQGPAPLSTPNTEARVSVERQTLQGYEHGISSTQRPHSTSDPYRESAT